MRVNWASLLILSFLLICVTSAPAFTQVNITLTSWPGNPPAGTSGTGTLMSVARAAADTWQNILSSNMDGQTHNLHLYIAWGASNPAAGVYYNYAGGGTPYRQTDGYIEMNNSGSVAWFVDANAGSSSGFRPNPWYSGYTSSDGGSQANYQYGYINNGHVFFCYTGDCYNHLDLFTVLLHEMGHALGLNNNSPAFQQIVGVGAPTFTSTYPYPWYGAVIQLMPGAHINSGWGYGNVMASNNYSERRLPSSADILLVCNVLGWLHPLFPGGWSGMLIEGWPRAYPRGGGNGR